MKIQKIKKYSFFITCLIAISSFSQNYKGTLQKTTYNGLHTLNLNTELRSASNDNFSSLRIKDINNNEVPYVIVSPSNKNFTVFNPIKITSNKVIKDSITSIEVKNKTKNTFEELVLEIINTKITKTYSVLGSNDSKKWYGLVSNKTLSNINSSNNTSVKKTIPFPLNNYTFIKVVFNDKNSLPINVIGAGVYKNKFFKTSSTKLAKYKKETVLLKEKKLTRIKFSAEESHKINTISFKINTEYFLRKAKVFVQRIHKVKKREEIYTKTLSTFELNAKNENTFTITNLNEKEFFIEIENEDNPPLDIEHIQLLQKPKYLISNLKKNEIYDLIIDTTLTKPKYDLGNFISENTKVIKEIALSSFLKIKKTTEPIKAKSFWQTAIFMWICIVIGGILVVYFALGLLKDVNSQEKK
ncbi:hypothetical protein [Tenacibaculum sp. nBUS_03]|uniref:hypothetical protein n=1 Tax=Tenacibaculum sp. nBUS_03 TaxID=3395320 RepID=UPI003EBBA407